MGSKEVRLNGQPVWAERYGMIVSRVGIAAGSIPVPILDSRALGVLVRRAAESIVTLRLDDAVETPPATETNRCFRLWAVPPVKGGKYSLTSNRSIDLSFDTEGLGEGT